VLPETNSKGAGAGDEATAGVDEGGEGVIRLFSPIIWMLGSGQWASPLSAMSRPWHPKYGDFLSVCFPLPQDHDNVGASVRSWEYSGRASPPTYFLTQ
jgi:hypothetical protein